jgi:molecular chaperone DnaK
MVVGFDFGTTNSLISVIVRDRAIDVFDDDGRPYPSVVTYRGEEVVVGREAKQSLDGAGIGIAGDTVRSPKIYLGQEVLNVLGVERSPIDIVADVIRHVRARSLASAQRKVLGDLDQAVVTIPVNMNGPRRAALRAAFNQSGISIVQFVHEPLAALYGFLRDPDNLTKDARALMRRFVLVVDWGGGTLDLTLCRLEPGRILQLRNGGTDRVGGDEFDQVIRDEVVKRFTLNSKISETDHPLLDARLRLLQETERNKIDLSERDSVTFYRPSYFPESGATLEYVLSRSELNEITSPLVTQGIREIDALLDSAGIAPAQISACVVVGGMAAMPAIRSRLHEMFGPEKVVVPKNSATLVAQGAAWIAHDTQRLVLAKPVELELARGARLPVLRAGTTMPTNGEVRNEQVHLFCTDPSDGLAKLSFVTPTELGENPQAADPRTTLGVLSIKVDETAPPLTERLELRVTVDDDLILTVSAQSSQRGDRASASYHDLEFGLGLPGSEDFGPDVDGDGHRTAPSGGLVMRANISAKADQSLIPGDVLHKARPQAFARLPGMDMATPEQRLEHLYTQPCGVCKRQWGDPDCRCASKAS